jgi:hypothetical protein
MGLPRPFKPPKSPTSVMADANAPPVFNKHIDLHKGLKSDHHNRSTPAPSPSLPVTPPRPQQQQQQQQQQHRLALSSNGVNNKVAPSPIRGLPATSNHTAGSGTGNSTSSTSLWLAQAEEVAAHEKTPAKSISQSDHSGAQSSYYEEEVISEDDEEADGYFDEAGMMNQQSERSMDDLSGTELDLFPEHIPTIRFDEYDEMQTVLHINDYTKYEINKTWYKREDYDKMVKLARKTAEKAEERRKELEQIARKQKKEKQGQSSGSDKREERRNGNDGKEEHLDAPNLAASHPSETVSQRSHRSNSSSYHQRSRSGRSLDENSGDTSNHEHDDEDTGDPTMNGTEKKPIENRGLEAWTASGAAMVKLLKESAIELVWNEQSRQWDAGLFDPDAIRNVYLSVSQTAAAAALERGKSDAEIVKRLKELEAMELEKKRRRRLLGKSKDLVKQSVKLTGRGVKQTGKIVQKTTKKTTKLAKDVTKRGVKAGVATATLDPRMMKEALKVSIKKRECKHETIIRPSNAHIQEETGTLRHYGEVQRYLGENVSLFSHSVLFSPFALPEKQNSGRDITPQNSFGENDRPDHRYEGADESSVEGDSEHASLQDKKKMSKLKLLGVVPIPGTKKEYKEDRREKKAEKRIQKQSRRPAWEAGVSAGKY